MEVFGGGPSSGVGVVDQLFPGASFVKILCVVLCWCVHSYPEGRRAGGPASSPS